MPEDFIGGAVGGLTRLLGQRTQMAEQRRASEEETLRKMGLWNIEQEARKTAVVQQQEWQAGMAKAAHKRRTAETQRQEDVKSAQLDEATQGTLAALGLGRALETPMTQGLRREVGQLEDEARDLQGQAMLGLPWVPPRRQFVSEGIEDARAEIGTIREMRRERAGVPADIEQDIRAGTIKSAAQAKTIIAQRREKAGKEASRVSNAQVMEQAGAPAWLVQSVKTGETTLPGAMILHEKVKAGELAGKKAKPRVGAQSEAKKALYDAFLKSGVTGTAVDFADWASQQAKIWEAFQITDPEMIARLIAQEAIRAFGAQKAK